MKKIGLFCVIMVAVVVIVFNRRIFPQYCKADGCKERLIDSGSYCFMHECFNSGCTNPRAWNERYCDECLSR